MTALCILWHRLDQPGHESARLVHKEGNWHLEGTAVFAYNHQPCRLDYLVVCNSAWETRSGRVSGWVGDELVEIELSVDSSHRWFLDRVERLEVAGCIDLDLNFSPSTNLLPIRRLGLAVGQEREVRAAWLRFPGFTLEPLDQSYRRVDVTTYRYESAGGKFVRELGVNEVGFVTSYPDFWHVETGETQ